ncbi:hypothetical protein LguiA_003333 [Lonicera macranthoides]
MGRAKVNMELIKNERTRNSTFQKRKIGLKKKTRELSTLCGVKACVILAGPPLSGQAQELETWPENLNEIKDLIKNYKQQSTEDHRKRTLTLLNFLEERKKKAENSLMKLRKENYELKYPSWDERYNGWLEEQLRGVGSFLEGKIEVAKARIELLKGSQRMEMLGSNFVVENENSSYSGAQFFPGQNMPYSMQSLVSRGSTEFEVIHPQGAASGFNSNDPFDQTQQGLPLNANQMMMMLMNNSNCSQFGNDGAFSSNMLYAPLTRPPVYYDQGPVMMQSMAVNNLRPPPGYYCGTAVRPIPPYFQYPMITGNSSQMHASQVDEYFEVGDFETKKPLLEN